MKSRSPTSKTAKRSATNLALRVAKKRSDRYHHGDLREAIITAAERLLRDEGIAGVSLREAARLAGVSHQAPYRHFADKEALLAAIAEDGFRKMGAAMLAGMDRAGDDPGARFSAQGREYVRFSRHHPGAFRVMFGPEVFDKTKYEGLRQAEEDCFALLRGAVVAAQARGQLPPGDSVAFAIWAWSLTHGLSSLIVDGQLARRGITTEDQLLALADFVTGGAPPTLAGASVTPRTRSSSTP